MFSDGFQNVAPPSKFEVGKVIGLSFGAIGRNWLAFGVLAVVLVFAPSVVESYLFPFAASQPAISFARLWNILSVIAQGSTLNALFIAAVTWIVCRQDQGEKPGIVEALRASLAIALWIIGVGVIRLLLEWVGLVLLIIPGIMAILALWVAIPACVVERLGIAASIRRSLELTRGQRLRLFGLLVAVWLIVVLPGSLIAFTGRILGQALLATKFDLDPWILGLRSVLSSLIYASAFACSYVELRNIKEGVGADSVAKVFG